MEGAAYLNSNNKTITRKKFNILGTIFNNISVILKNYIKILFIEIIINDPWTSSTMLYLFVFLEEE